MCRWGGVQLTADRDERIVQIVVVCLPFLPPKAGPLLLAYHALCELTTSQLPQDAAVVESLTIPGDQMVFAHGLVQIVFEPDDDVERGTESQLRMSKLVMRLPTKPPVPVRHHLTRSAPFMRYFRLLDDLAQIPLVRVPPPLKPGEAVLGVYENEPGSDRDMIVVTDHGMHLRVEGGWTPIAYDTIERVNVDMVLPKMQTHRIMIALRDGEIVDLPIRGGDGRFRDVFAFHRFLRRFAARAI